MTLLAYFVVAAVPLGLLALFSLCAHKPEADSLFLDGKDMRWWESGVALLAILFVVAVPYLLGIGVVWVISWALLTLGWVS